MNALSLGATAASAAGHAAAGARSGGSSTDKPAGGFDALLNPATGSGGNIAPAADGNTPRQDSGTRPDEDTPTAETSASEDAGVEKPSSDDTDDHSSDTPWPPLGLSALIPPPAEPVQPAAPPPAAAEPVQPAAPSPAAAAAGGKQLPAALAQTLAPALPAAATALAASTKSTPDALPQISLPTAAVAARIDDSSDSPDLLAFQQILQGISAPEVRAPAATSSIVPGAPPDVRSPDFDEAFGARIGWMAEQKIGHAHIRITPHDMGQIDVKLQLDGDRVHATFSSAHAEVRSALENSLPRLREMLGEQGLQLAQADVGQQRDAPAGEDARAGADPSRASTSEGVGSPVTEQAAPMRYLRGLLDTYA